MTLIAHYKEKAQYEQMRNVYERFFKIFPDAVCLSIPALFTANCNPVSHGVAADGLLLGIHLGGVYSLRA